MKNKEQQEEMKALFHSVEGSGKLDYVCAWYLKGAAFIQGTPIKVAFVSTNSISQGEQPPILWRELLPMGIKIDFAHRTFQWSNEGKGVATVQCVIIGFSLGGLKPKLFEYSTPKSEPVEKSVKTINPYLVEAANILIDKRTKPLCNVPVLIRGSIPYDNGHLLLTEEERQEVLKTEPHIESYIRKYGGSNEALNNTWRYCLWLNEASPEAITQSKFIMKRIEQVREFRSLSTTLSVNGRKDTPSIFGDIRQPKSDYLLIPRVSSENRIYLPIVYVGKEVICADSAYALPDATLYHFGVLSSRTHNVWLRAVCGRLESRFRYSSNIVYNNFPWPLNDNAETKKNIEIAAQKVLDERAKHGASTLAAMYKNLTVFAELFDAHKQLDKAVEKAYGYTGSNDDAEIVGFLFNEYQTLTNLPSISTKKTRKSK